MRMNIAKEIAALARMTVGELQERYVEVCGEPTRSRHKQYLIRRIAWRLQAIAEGGLSERALRRAEELANIADVRVTPPAANTSRRAASAPSTADCDSRRTAAAPYAGDRDSRLPPPGTAITRRYKGRTISVTVLPDGFEYDGERYKSLSALAKAITGSHVNGFRFFKLESRS